MHWNLEAWILDELLDLGCDSLHPVPLGELRRRLAAVPRDEFCRALLSLETSGKLTLLPGRGDDESAIRHTGRGALGLVGLEPPPPLAESLIELRARVLEAVLALGHCPGCGRKPLATLRRAFPEVPREDLDRALLMLELRGSVRLLPAEDPEAIQPRLRRASIDGHDRGLLSYVVPAAETADPRR
ncbi:MAG TPA: hypothetical protein VFF73_06650 [Planctomycetota bacterium]|nr:hypothetical protein [Planctomycetota bacterium]